MNSCVRLVLVGMALAPGAAAGQAIPFSQHATVSQRVGVTDIAIEYNRPTARGRILFGQTGIVRSERVWNPGADSATRITFSRDVEVEGRAVAAGRYTLWLRPADAGPWTLIVSRAADVFHTPYPGEEGDVLRVAVTPETGSHMEALAFYFPVVLPDAAVLRMHWGTTIIAIRLRAPATE